MRDFDVSTLIDSVARTIERVIEPTRKGILVLLAVTALMTLPARAQTADQVPGTPVPQPTNLEGSVYGGYQVQQSIEVGGRITDVTGSDQMYNTFTNLHSGPRLLSQTLFMQSLSHTGNLFDMLDMSSFGWGGDPNNALRLNIRKYKWYEFNASFRRDQYYFDYNLFANPLNPPTSTPSIPVDFSPHSYFLRHRMYDFSLKLLPQSKVSFRLEYSRNREEGPSYSSVHFGTDALLNQPWNTTVNRYRIGMTWRVLPKTTISYDQFFKYNKNDTGYNLAQFATFNLPDGTPAELGLPWDTAGNSPCRVPLVGGLANPTCNAYLLYSRSQRMRTSIPTEQLTLQSRTIPKLDLMGRFQYSSASMDTGISELFNGLETRTAGRQEVNTTSNDHASWVTVVTELGATYHITDRLRILDTFQFNNWRIPGSVLLSELAFFNDASILPPGSLTSPIATFPGATLLHTTSSPADVTLSNNLRFLGENDKSNEIRVEYDFSRRAGGSLGYRFRHRLMHHADSTAIAETYFPLLPNRGDCVGVPLNPDGTCSTTTFDSGVDDFPINEHTGILSLWANPIDSLRLNFNMELMSADNFITRISPTHQQQYRARVSYRPRPWLNVGGNMNFLERRNKADIIDYLGHVRDVGFNATVAPNDRFSMSLNYNFQAYQQNANVCFVDSATPAGAITCALDDTLLQTAGNYDTHTHYGGAFVNFKPVKRISTSLGYNVTSVDGNTLILNPLQPLGPLAYTYHQPMAALGIEFSPRIMWNVGWNYDQYNEQGAVGPTAPRYFHDNRTTLSLRYAF